MAKIQQNCTDFQEISQFLNVSWSGTVTSVAEIQRFAPVPPVALTVAGSDSSGGAGIQADLRAFDAFAVFGCSALTAITAQNTLGVTRVEVLDPALVAAQIESCLADLPVAAIKTGMLAGAATIEAVAERLRAHACGSHGPALVVDPVMIATSGARLLDADAIELLKTRLLPLAMLVTPNLHEAAALTGCAIDDDPRQLGRALLETGVRAVLVKGGHGHDRESCDWLIREDGERAFRRDRIPGSFHGTGCALSAAIAAQLAHGKDLDSAVEQAGDWLHGRIEQAFRPLAGPLGVLPFGPAQRRHDY
jgi:hydroxymethylpyrimidine/phosphomethylpyrimidine kinase